MYQAIFQRCFRSSLQAMTCFAALLAAMGCAATRPLPVLDQPAFSIRSFEAAPEADATAAKIDCILKHYCSLFDVSHNRLDPLTVILGSRKSGYGIDEFPALYQCSTRSIHFKRKPDTMLLLHEIAHHFMQMRFGDNIPIWLNEGIATYLGWSAMDKEHLAIGEIPIIHFKTVKAMSLDDELMPLDRFFSLKAAVFYDPARSARHYSQAWGFVFFMMHGFYPRHLSFRRKLDLIMEMPEAELATYEPLFKRFCSDFSAAQMLQERLYTEISVRRLSSAFRLGLLQDADSMNVLMRQARNRENDRLLRLVALYAGAMIAIRASDPAVHDELQRTLLLLKHQKQEEISAEAGALHEMMQHQDLKKIVHDFVALSEGGCFYPTSRFRGDGG